MIQLPNVTLCCIDNLGRHELPLKTCTDVATFGKVLHLSPDINTKEDYSRFVLRDLVNHIDTDFVLIVQYDGYIINPKAWTKRFLDYDYIGAPWWYDGHNVGNGGFSLRSRAMLEACMKIPALHPEDDTIRLYAQQLKMMGIKFAPEALAERFSFEQNWKHTEYKGSFGFHGNKPNTNNQTL